MPASVETIEAMATIELKRKQLGSHASKPGSGDGKKARKSHIVKRKSATNKAEDVRAKKAGARSGWLELPDSAKDSGRELRGDRVSKAEKPMSEDDMPPISSERTRITKQSGKSHENIIGSRKMRT